jgi:hypothetical protein
MILRTPPTETTTTSESIWEGIARENGWPEPVLLKNMTPDRLPGFPYSRGGFRNRVTGKDPDPFLSDRLFSYREVSGDPKG